MGGKKKMIQSKLKTINSLAFHHNSSKQIKTFEKLCLNKIPVTRIKLLTILTSNLLFTIPAHAEAGKIFDFNATLPVMAAQFLLLMVFLEKTWFGPVGGVLDKRNDKILTRVKSLSEGTGESESLLKEARAEVKTKMVEAKAKSEAKAESELSAEKLKLDLEVTRAIKELEAEKAATQKDIDSQVAVLSKYIIEKVLPNGFQA